MRLLAAGVDDDWPPPPRRCRRPPNYPRCAFEGSRLSLRRAPARFLTQGSPDEHTDGQRESPRARSHPRTTCSRATRPRSGDRRRPPVLVGHPVLATASPAGHDGALHQFPQPSPPGSGTRRPSLFHEREAQPTCVTAGDPPEATPRSHHPPPGGCSSDTSPMSKASGARSTTLDYSPSRVTVMCSVMVQRKCTVVRCLGGLSCRTDRPGAILV
jgi:hypothetical protein